MFGPPLVAITSERLARSHDRLAPHLFGQGALVAIVGGVVMIVVLWEHQPLSSIGVRPLSWESLAWGLALAAFFMYVFAPAAYSTLRRLKLRGFEDGLAKLGGLPVWYVVIAVLVGGVSEELLYRGFAIERVAVITGSYWLAGLIPLSVFGLAHIPMWGWGPALTTPLSGGVLTLVYIWRQDLAVNIIAHVLTDLAGIVFVRRPLCATSSKAK
jgi:membrane protease YdiL (CAAX protease family)